MCEFYARGKTYEELHQQNRIRAPQWQKYAADTSFKFLVTAFNHTIPQWRQKDVMESFDYMDWQGKIDMKNPEVTLFCLEECRYTLLCPINGTQKRPWLRQGQAWYYTS